MEDVIADTSFTRVLTYSFFPADAMSDASLTAAMSQAPTSVPPQSQLAVHTPPMESFFSPLSLLLNAPSLMLMPPL
ncbi:hypothetical protein ZOSMA_45G00410 [Zostera marina]|uniref:Uncharacterized protein n=1 Tax=Zostera marina TaxID=29655 RepID=A0A0K9P2R3_ZOSMR|nr:hypothetical protein ZOSMA_45G00410 [Zostera marina]